MGTRRHKRSATSGDSFSTLDADDIYVPCLLFTKADASYGNSETNNPLTTKYFAFAGGAE
jgi:hypothetical protein